MHPSENPTPPTPSKAFPDFNNNGIADYREGWFWRTTWRAFRWAVHRFAAPHTVLYKAVEVADQAHAAIGAGAEDLELHAVFPEGAKVPPSFDVCPACKR
ncbi:hypothetical protein JRI60_26865 [Archangium violaceum]|uniref:hypothetical protein n=1 Tax=Archangium violaceum TaxID=83451 RepID=UPI00194E3931|nr:hypothetical protein [Archangium violaceum]QRN92834.1 hypothetical protein JRI60_26865 [Archangium violaceum]